MMSNLTGSQKATALPLDFISGIWGANRIISKPPFCITIRSLFLSLVMEKRSGQKKSLAQKWGFPEGLHETVGTGLSDEAAANLPIPKKDELLGYLRSSYEAIEQFIELLDTKYPNFENMDEELRKKIEMIRLNLLVFISHDCRHLGMMECLKGLQTGFGSATEKR